MTKRSNSLIVLLLLLTISVLQAQPKTTTAEAVRQATLPTFSSPDLETRNLMDTLGPRALNDVCGETFVVYTPIDDWGFIAGTNAFGDKEKAQLIENTTNTAIIIQEVWAFFGYVAQVGNGNVRVKLYDVDPGGRPASLIAQSNDVRVADIRYSDTLALGTPFSFPTSVDVDRSSFFISVDFSSLYNTFDTVSLYHTELGCGSGNEAFELWSDNQWFSMIEAWAGVQDFDVNFAVVAIVEFDAPNAVASPYYQQDGLRLFPATPNPARQRALLNYELTEAGPVKIELYGADGRHLRDWNLGRQPAGRHSTAVDLSGLPTGTYVYSILTEKTRVASRLVVK